MQIFNSLIAEYTAPTNEREKTIVEAFEKVFNKDKIGIYDDFIRLGGDSLTAIKLLSYIGEYNITAADILSLRTPYAIANIKDLSLDLNIYTLESGCPLNESQLNVYLDIIANNKKDAYIIPLSIEISKEYSVNDINNALNELCEVHPILNMCVSDESYVPYLIKRSKPQIIIESDVDNDYISEFSTKAFDLHDSLCRFLIVTGFTFYS